MEDIWSQVRLWAIQAAIKALKTAMRISDKLSPRAWLSLGLIFAILWLASIILYLWLYHKP